MDIPPEIKKEEIIEKIVEHACVGHACACGGCNFTFNLDARFIDWRALRVQKMLLLTVAETNPDIGENESQALGGLVNLLDMIQDAAIDQGIAHETDVFTHEELYKSGIEDVDDAPFVLAGPTNKDWLDAFSTREAAEIQVENLSKNYDIAARVITKEEWDAARNGES